MIISDFININYINNHMAGVQRRKSGAKNKKLHRGLKTKNYIRDHDQIHQDLKQQQKFQDLEVDQDKPGSGQFYCIGCSRFFQSQSTMDIHKSTKKHKRMLKKMLQKPYTHQEAYQAGK